MPSGPLAAHQPSLYSLGAGAHSSVPAGGLSQLMDGGSGLGQKQSALSLMS